jgi:hypothetical protein
MTHYSMPGVPMDFRIAARLLTITRCFALRVISKEGSERSLLENLRLRIHVRGQKGIRKLSEASVEYEIPKVLRVCP